MRVYHFYIFIVVITFSCQPDQAYDTLITNATIYDGSGNAAYLGMVGINADTIAYVGTMQKAKATHLIEANGKALSPGFINMLSWATEDLLVDGRGMSDIMQGVTLEVMGEGWSMGPLNEQMRQDALKSQADYTFDIPWTTLGEYLQHLENKGVSPNVASYVGATTLRIHELGHQNRAPTAEELERMKSLARSAMEEGALGIGSSLIYAPAFYAETNELIELCKAVAPYGGSYITHMRSEGNKFLEGIDEVITIAASAKLPAEIYHLKAAGANNHYKMDLAIAKIDSARKKGIEIRTNMYNYIAGATGLDASMPPWVQEGGYESWAKRLKDPLTRKKVMAEMKTDAQDWENLYYSAGGAENILLVGFDNPELKKYTGLSLKELAEQWKLSPEETAIELVIQDGSRVGTVYFLMSEENVKKQMKLPYMSFGSDGGAKAANEPFTKSGTHPRAYGNVARLLGKYVRDEGVISLEEAIYKLSMLPATHLKLANRGALRTGYFADLVLFDPATIEDIATFENPHQYAKGVMHVWVNGEHVVKDGAHTGVTSGRFIKGPGYKMG